MTPKILLVNYFGMPASLSQRLKSVYLVWMLEGNMVVKCDYSDNPSCYRYKYTCYRCPLYLMMSFPNAMFLVEIPENI